VSPVESSGQARPLRLAIGGAVAFVLTLMVMAGAKGCTDLRAVRERKTVLEERIGVAESEITRLRHHLDRLRDDPVTLERVAREQLGMVDPRDVVIVLPEPAEPTAPASGAADL